MTILRAGEWLVSACPQGQSVDALYAKIVAAREDLGLIIMLIANGTRDLLLQLLHTFRILYHLLKSVEELEKEITCAISPSAIISAL